MLNKEELKKCYNNWASSYDIDAQFNAAVIQDHPIILKLIEPELNHKSFILDLGCGTGILTSELAQKTGKTIGVDISEKMILQARKKKSLAEFIVHDVSTGLAFPESYFDVVFSALTLSHIENIEIVYKDVSRVLKDGGCFIFDEITSSLKKPFVPKYYDFLKVHSETAPIWQRHAINEHLVLAKKYGLEIEELIETTIDKKIIDVIDESDYVINKGCPFTTIIKLRKNFASKNVNP